MIGYEKVGCLSSRARARGNNIEETYSMLFKEEL